MKNIGLIFILFLSIGVFAQRYEAKFTTSIDENELIIEYTLEHLQGDDFAFAYADFPIIIDPKVVNLEASEILEDGYWSESSNFPDYFPAELEIFDDSILIFRIEIKPSFFEKNTDGLNVGHGNGLVVPKDLDDYQIEEGDEVFLGRISIPIINCSSAENVELRWERLLGERLVLSDIIRDVSDVAILVPAAPQKVALPQGNITKDASFTGLKATYCTSSYLSVLTPKEVGGTFQGPGIKQSNDIWYFDPQEAGPGIHKIIYKIQSNCGPSETNQFTVVNPAPCVSTVVSDETSAFIADPIGIATDCNGQIYTSSSKLNALTKVDTFGVASVIAGDTSEPAGFLDGPALKARMQRPLGMVLTSNDDIYFVDGANHAVRQYVSATDQIVTIAGGGDKINLPLSGDSDIPADKAANRMFDNPSGIAINSTEDTLYVADGTNRKVKGISLISGDVFTIAGKKVLDENLPTLGNPIAAGEFVPSDLGLSDVVYYDRQLFIVDQFENTIMRYDERTKLVSFVAGGIGADLGKASTEAKFNTPFGIAVDGEGNLFVVDQSNRTIKKFEKNGDDYDVRLLAGSGKSGCVDGTGTDARFRKPGYLAVYIKGFVDIVDFSCDQIRRIAIDDYLNNPLKKFEKDYCVSSFKDTINPTTVSGYYSIDGKLLDSTGGYWTYMPEKAGTYEVCYFHNLGQCAGSICSSFKVYDNPKVSFLSDTVVCNSNLGIDSLVLDTFYTNYQWGYTDNIGDAFSKEVADTNFYKIVDKLGFYTVTITDTNKCSVTDIVNVTNYPDLKIIYSLSSATDSLCAGTTRDITVEKVAGTGTGTIASYQWNTGEITQTITADKAGIYYVKAIDQIGCSADTSYTNIIKNPPTICIQVDSTYLNDEGLRYGEWKTATLAGKSGERGLVNDQKGTAARFNRPWDVYYDKDTLYITEQGNNANRIRKISLSDTLVSTLAGTANSGEITHNTILSLAKFDEPTGIVRDKKGDFYVANQGAHVISKITKDSVFVLAGIVGDFEFKNGKGTNATFNQPHDMVIDAFGNIYVADNLNFIIRKITPEGEVTTFAGKRLPTVLDEKGVNAGFHWPWGLALAPNGNIYVTDDGGHTFREIVTSDTVVTTIAGDATQLPSFHSSNTYKAISGKDARFSRPWNLVSDRNGNVYMTDGANNAVRMINPKGEVITIAGAGPSFPGTTDGKGKDARFEAPAGITINPNTGVLYVADNANHTIRTLQQNKTIRVCHYEDVPLNANCSDANSYKWTLPNGSFVNTANIVAKDSGRYIVEVTKNGCTNTDSVFIEYKPKELLSIGNDLIICQGDSVEFSVSASPTFTFYTWNEITSATKLKEGATATSLVTKTNGQYELVALDIRGCLSRDTARVTVDNIQVDLTATRDSVCFRENVELSATPINQPLGKLTYLWEYKADQAAIEIINTTQDKDTSLTTVVEVLGNVNKYFVTIKDVNNCSYKDSLTVFRNDTLIANIIPDTLFICGDETLINTVDATVSKGFAPYQYLWTSSDDNLVTLTNKDSLKVGIASKTSTNSQVTLSLTVTDKLGCKAQDQTIAKLELLKFKFNKEHEVICPGLSDSLFAEVISGGSGDYKYLWTGQELPTNDLKHVIVSPNTPQYHKYTLSIFDNVKQCQANNYTDSILVRTITTNISGGDTIILCHKEVSVPTNINSTGTGAIPYKTGAPYKYTWKILSGTGDFVGRSDTLQTVQIEKGTVNQYTHLSLQIVDSLNCKNTDSVHVLWNLPITQNTLDSIYLCKGDSQQVVVNGTGGTGTLSYKWNRIKGNVLVSNTNINNPVFKYPSTISGDTSLVVLTITDENKCEKVDTVKILNIDFKPEIEVKDSKVCANAPINLGVKITEGGSGKYKYKWTASNGTLSNDTISNPIGTPTTTVTYSLTITDLVTGCTDVVNKIITFTPLNSVISVDNKILNDTIVICSGRGKILDASLSNGGDPFDVGAAYKYVWTKIGSGILSNTDKKQAIISSGSVGTYTKFELKIEDEQGCTGTTSVMTYWNRPIKSFADTAYVCTPNSGVLQTDSIRGLSPIKSYVWQELNTSKLTIETPFEKTSVIEGILDNDTINVSLVIQDSAGCTGIDTFTVVGLDFEAKLIAQSDSICPNVKNTLEVNVINDGKGSYKYQWSPNRFINDTASQKVVVNPDSNITYNVIVTDSITKCMQTLSQTIKVVDLKAEINSGLNNFISCLDTGKEITLDANASKGGSPNYTYQWTSLDTNLSFTNADQVLVTVTDNGLRRPATNYVKLTITDTKGCIDYDSLAIFWAAPIIPNYTSSLTQDTIFTCGDSIRILDPTVTGGVGKYTYNWSIINGNIQFLNAATDSIQKLEYPAGETKKASTIVLNLRDSAGCIGIDTIIIKPADDFAVSTKPEISKICPNTSTQIELRFTKGGQSTYNYVWSPSSIVTDPTEQDPTVSPLNTTIYSVLVTDQQTSCKQTDTTKVEVIDLKAFIAHEGVLWADTGVVCLGDLYNLDASLSSGGKPFLIGDPYKYSWTKLTTDTSKLLTKIDSIGISIRNGTPKTITQVALTITDADNCQNKDTINVYWNDKIEPYADTAFVCTPSKGQIDVDSIQGGNGPYTYQWEITNDSLNQYLTLENITNDTALVTIDSTRILPIQITVADSAGCKGSSIAQVAGLDFRAIITPQYSSICKNLTDTINVQVRDGKGKYSYAWTRNQYFTDTTKSQIVVVLPKTTQFTVAVKDSITGCADTTSGTVIVKLVDVVAGSIAGPDTVLACGETHVVTASNTSGGTRNYTYEWKNLSTNQSLQNANQRNVTVVDEGINRISTTLLSLHVIDNLGCNDSIDVIDSVYIKWLPIVKADIRDEKYVCVGGEKELTGIVTGGSLHKFNWTIQSGAATLKGDTTQIKSTVQGNTYKDVSTIRFTVTDSSGCVVFHETQIESQQIDQADIRLNHDMACPGTDIKATALGQSNIPNTSLSYNWDGKIFGKANTLEANVKTDSTFNVIIKDSISGCLADIKKLIDIEKLVALAGLQVGQDTILSCLDSMVVPGQAVKGGTGVYMYQWTSTNTTNIELKSSINDTVIVLDKGLVRPSVREYLLTITDNTGCQGKDSVYLDWNPSVSTQIKDDFYTCVNENEIFESVTTGGTGTYKYTWSVKQGGLDLKGDTTQERVTVLGKTRKDISTLSLRVVDEKGCITTDTLVVETQQVRDTSLNLNFNQVCTGSEVTATALGGSSITTTKLLYSWDAVNFGTINTYKSKVRKDTLISVVIKDSLSNCTASLKDSIKIKNLKVSIASSVTKTLCFEESTKLTTTVEGGAGVNKYQWLEELITDLQKDSAIVNIRPSAKGASTGTYYKVIVTDQAGCQGTDSVELFRNHEILINAGKDTNLCINDVLILGGTNFSVMKNGSSADLGVKWEILTGSIGRLDSSESVLKPAFSSELKDQVYNIKLTATDKTLSYCTVSDEIKIITKGLPVAQLTDTSFCDQSSLVLNPKGLPYPKGTNLTWTLPDDSKSKLDTLVTEQEGNHVVVAVDTFGCTSTAKAFVNKIALPTVKIVPNGAVACTNEKAILTALVTPKVTDLEGGNIQWSVIEGTGTLNSETDTNTFYNPVLEDINVKIIVVYDNGCPVGRDTLEAPFSPAPIVEASISDIEVNIDDPVLYEFDAEQKTTYEYTWVFEGLSLDTIRTVGPHEFTYPKKGTYNSWIIVKDTTTNCIAKDSLSLVVNTINQLYIPNVFSLSAKNSNNATWKFFGKNISEENFLVEVYNRWGDLVYQTSDLGMMKETGWNGEHQDDDQTQILGVYTYIVKGQFENQQEFEKVGTVTIVR